MQSLPLMLTQLLTLTLGMRRPWRRWMSILIYTHPLPFCSVLAWGDYLGIFYKMRKIMRKRNFRKRGKRVAYRSKAFTKAVQKIVHKDVETKQAYTAIASTGFNSGISGSGDNFRVMPNINQGTADNSRIGDQIRAQSITLKGALVYNPSLGSYGAYANARLAVRVMVVQPKNLTDYASVDGAAASWQNILLKKGGTTSPFTGVLNDLWAPINSDAITKYYDKVFYLQGTYQATAVGSSQLLGSTKFFRHTFKLRNKLLRYDTNIGSGLIPTNYAPTLIIGYAHMDGSSPDVASTAISVSYDSIVNYEDA